MVSQGYGYKYIELVKIRALLENKANYDAKISLQSRKRSDITWWAENVHLQTKSLIYLQPNVQLFTDASLSGWGAKLNDTTTGGQWASHDMDHINVLELKAVLFGLQSLCGDMNNVHIRIRSDNTTTVACIERCSSTKLQLLNLTEQIYIWASKRSISLSATHIRGVENVDADAASRSFNSDTEWMIEPNVFQELCDVFTKPDIDLFASRINAQLSNYVSWRPDPEAQATDAFGITWNYNLHYGFPPFSVIGQTIRKIQRDRANFLLIAPLWPTRPWFSRALQLLADFPYLLPKRCLHLPQDPDKQHPLSHKLVLVALPLSGIRWRSIDFRQKLPSSSSVLGEPGHTDNMGVISKDGCRFVVADRLIHFRHL